jgi:hypothetical protein
MRHLQTPVTESIMRLPRQLYRAVPVLFILASGACNDVSEPASSREPTSWTTPTGLVTTTPPQIAVGAGDIADCNKPNDEATANLLDNIAGTVLVFGDNVYENGTTTEYQNCYNPTWGRHKARTMPSAGNHEYNTPGATGYYNYFGAAAGDPAKGYYTYELGGWHVIVLNSNISMKVGSGQYNWLTADLAASQNLCTMAYWHHPLYSSTSGTGTGGLTYSSVRPLVDALYQGGADLILMGHRHFYERLAPMKPDGTRDDVFGTRHMIVGTGGKSTGSQTNIFPTSEARNGNTYGVVKLYLYEDGYAWKFVPIAGKTYTDSGSTACHGKPGSPPPPAGVSATLSTISANPTALTAGGDAAIVTVTARNTSGDPISGASVILSATGSRNTLIQPSAPTDVNGVATGSISSSVAQPKVISAIINGVTITQVANITVSPGPAAMLEFEVQPTSGTTGTPITPAIQVEIQDAFENRIPDATDEVSIALGANASGATLSGTTTTAAVNGIATFGDLSIDLSGVGYTLVASAVGLTHATSNPFDRSSNPVAQITHSLLTAGNDPLNTKIYTTAVITPAPNTLITLAIASHRSTAASGSPVVTGGGMAAWTEVATITYDPLSLPLKRISIFRAMSAAPGSGPLTITFPSTVSNAQWIVSQWDGVEITGTNGSDAIVQTASNAADVANGLLVSLAQFSHANNVAYGVFGARSSTAVINPGAGFTEIGEQSSAESPNGTLQAQWAKNIPGISASWTNLPGAALGIEIRARAF